MNPQDIKIYAAAFLDGEGCIYKKRTGSYTITFYNTCNTPLKAISSVYGGHIYKQSRKKYGKVCKDIYTLHITSKEELIKLLSEITPYLLIKGHKAKEALLYVYNYQTSHKTRNRNSDGTFKRRETYANV